MNIKNGYKQKAIELAKKRGVVRSSELTNLGIPRVIITRLVNENQLERLARGLYCLPENDISENEGLIIIARLVPKAVFCLLTALQLHELTTQLPRKVWIAMPKGSHTPRIDYPPVKMVAYSGKSYTTGIEEIEIDNVKLKTYNTAKTIADCFKYRNNIGIDVAIEALKDALEIKKTSIDEIWHYAKICRVSNIIRPYLEAIQ